MLADRKWVLRNLGFDPVDTPPPANAFSVAAARKGGPDDLQREIIDFDSDGEEGLRFLAFSKATGLSRFTDIPWPTGLKPVTADSAGGDDGGPLPAADVLVVTWTMDEGHALSRVLTPGKDSRDDYARYTHNYDAIAADMRPGCPARNYKRLGTYWRTTIAGKSVVVFKSDSHMSQDGPKLPNRTVWRQLIDEVKPRLVITTGTAGGIGTACEVGDVVVSPVVRFDCTAKFQRQPFAKADYDSAKADKAYLKQAAKLMRVNAAQLPADNPRPPKIIVAAPGKLKKSVVTTDFFGFDTSADTYHLQGLGQVSEMGDAVLGLVAADIGAAAPPWLAIRNVSDPQIKSEGSLKDQAKIAASIYKGYGRWSSVCSAIVCWAAIAAL